MTQTFNKSIDSNDPVSVIRLADPDTIIVATNPLSGFTTIRAKSADDPNTPQADPASVINTVHKIALINGGGLVSDHGVSVKLSFADGNEVTNAGTIQGALGGLEFVNSDDNSINNSGTIRSDRGAALILDGDDNQVLNVGTISSGFASGRSAIEVFSISGEYNSLNNKGVISGAKAIVGGDGIEDVKNSGTIHGDLLLNGGDDIYAGLAGEVRGRVHGGFGDDTLFGSTAHANHLIGGDGRDRLEGGTKDDILDGGIGADSINGGDGNDLITGGDGQDHMLGGNQNDTINGGAGADTVNGGSGLDFASYANAATQVTVDLGKPSANNGEALGDTYVSIEGIIGSRYNDRLFGDSGHNRFDGGLGVDTFTGGLGNDHYTIDRSPNGSLDVIIENAGEGADQVNVGFFGEYTLGPNIERGVLLTGGALKGNELQNTLVNDGSHGVLNGREGNDILIGGDGFDTFIFDTTLSRFGNVDVVSKFTHGEDFFKLDNAVFSGVGVTTGNKLAAASFRQDSVARDADDRIIYNKTTGELFYDGDGNGAGLAFKFAEVVQNPALSANDFIIF